MDGFPINQSINHVLLIQLQRTNVTNSQTRTDLRIGSTHRKKSSSSYSVANHID